jgi:hypothetical protein
MRVEPPVVRVPSPRTPKAAVVWSRLPLLLLAWIILFALGSLAIANPFATEVNAGVGPDFWGSMYLHGLLSALLGLLALVICQAFAVRSRSARITIAVSVIVATLATSIGGIFDRRLPGAEAATFTQNVGFFALDVMLVALIVGMVGELRRGAPSTRTLAFWTALLAAGATLIAAVLGHIAGWLLEFGAWPGFVAAYMRGRGVDTATFTADLIVAHSRAMMSGVMALLVSLAAQQFGTARLGRVSRAGLRTGLTMVGVGIATTTAIYVAMGLVGWQPPLLFQSGNGANGILADQFVLGVTVMLGGGVSIIALTAGRGVHRSLRIAAAWSWSLSFATVVLAGFAIELNETYFGAGAPWAAGATQDAVFTWVHQDIGLFLFPALVLLAVIGERSLVERQWGRIAWLLLAGTTITFAGAMVWVFVDPALHGPGYIVSSLGLGTLGVALVATTLAGLRRGAAGVRWAWAPSRAGPAGRALAEHH